MNNLLIPHASAPSLAGVGGLIRVAMLKDLPEKISIALALDLKKASSVDEMQNIINIYMHDHRAGLPRGIPAIVQYLTQTAQTSPQNTTKKTLKQHNPILKAHSQTIISTRRPKAARRATTDAKDMGSVGGCGEYGHPRRECTQFLTRIGKGQSQDVAALKGIGKNGKGCNLGQVS